MKLLNAVIFWHVHYALCTGAITHSASVTRTSLSRKVPTANASVLSKLFSAAAMTSGVHAAASNGYESEPVENEKFRTYSSDRTLPTSVIPVGLGVLPISTESSLPLMLTIESVYATFRRMPTDSATTMFSVVPRPVFTSDGNLGIYTLLNSVTPVSTLGAPTLSVDLRSQEIDLQSTRFVESLATMVPLLSTPVPIDHSIRTHKNSMSNYVIGSSQLQSSYKETSCLFSNPVNLETGGNILSSTTELFQRQYPCKVLSSSFLASSLKLSDEESNYKFVSSGITETSNLQLFQSLTTSGRQSALLSPSSHPNIATTSLKSYALFSQVEMVPKSVGKLGSQSIVFTEFSQLDFVMSSVRLSSSHSNMLSETPKSLHRANFSVASDFVHIQGTTSDVSGASMFSSSSLKPQLHYYSDTIDSFLPLKSSASSLLTLPSLLASSLVSQRSRTTFTCKDSSCTLSHVAITRHVSQYSHQQPSSIIVYSVFALSGSIYSYSVPVSIPIMSSSSTLTHLSSRMSDYSLYVSVVTSTVNPSFGEFTLFSTDGISMTTTVFSPSTVNATTIRSSFISTLYPSSSLPSTVSSQLCNTDYPPRSCNCFMCHNHCCIDELNETVLDNAVVISFAVAVIEQYEILECRFKTILIEYLELYCAGNRQRCFGGDITSELETMSYVFFINNVNVFEVKQLVAPVQALNLAFFVEVQVRRTSVNSSMFTNGTRSHIDSLQTVEHRARRNTRDNGMVSKDHYIPSYVLIEVLELHKNNISLSTGFSVVNGSIRSYLGRGIAAVSSFYSFLPFPTSTVETPGGQNDDNNNLLIIISAICGGFGILLVIIVVAVFCYCKQRRDAFSPVSQEHTDKDLLQRQTDRNHYELKDLKRSKQDNNDRGVPVRQSNYNGEREQKVEHKNITKRPSRKHSLRIQQILRRSRTCAVSPALVPDDDVNDDNDEERHRRTSLIALLNRNSLHVHEPGISHVAWAQADTTGLDTDFMSHEHGHMPASLQNTSYEHPSSVRTQELPVPRTALEPNVYSDLQLPRKNSTVVQSPELLRSSRRKLPSLRTPVNVHGKNYQRYSFS